VVGQRGWSSNATDGRAVIDGMFSPSAVVDLPEEWVARWVGLPMPPSRRSHIVVRMTNHIENSARGVVPSMRRRSFDLAARTVKITVAAALAVGVLVPVSRASAAEPSPGASVPIPYPDAAMVEDYLAATRMRAEPGVRDLFDRAADADLAGRARYAEEVTVGDEVVTIVRTVNFRLERGVCRNPSASPILVEHCVNVRSSATPVAEVTEELRRIRRALAGKSDDKVVTGGVTVREARALSDAALLDLVMNGGDRSIRRVSTVPRERFVGPTSDEVATDGSSTTGGGAATVGGDEAYGGSATMTPTTAPNPLTMNRRPWYGSPSRFDTEYLLTGFTHVKELTDDWEYTWAKSTWWHGRYYVKFSYEFTVGFGVRVPFSVDVSHRSGDPDSSKVDVAVDVVDVAADGAPAYPAVGLSPEKYHGGDEFVLQVEAACTLKISIPGPDPSVEVCDRAETLVNRDWNRNVVPPLGDESSVLRDWWLDGEDTGLELDVWFAKAWVDVGVAAEMTNGRIGYTVEPHPSTRVSGVGTGTVWKDSTERTTLTLERRATGDLGFSVTDPRYAFDLALTPKVRLNAAVDIGVYEKTVSRTFDLDFLQIALGVELDHHGGTTASQPFTLRWSGTEALDEEPAWTGGAASTSGTGTASTSPTTTSPRRLGSTGTFTSAAAVS
jgi:hypothetical protein